MPSESSKYKYEVWENPNRKDSPFYVKYRPRSTFDFFMDVMTWGTIAYHEGGITYFKTLEDALKEVGEHIEKDNYVPEKHIKRWP